MKAVACLFALFTLLTAACADEPAGFVGEPTCRVAKLPLTDNQTLVWKGPCKDGYASGPGVLERNQQGLLRDTVVASYEVTMARGHISGAGKLKSRDGYVYTGTFKDGEPDGKGYTVFDNGDQYEGDYRNDARNGTGIYLRDDGTEYQGEWKDGKFDGIGSVKFALGGSYVGGWKSGKFHGRGVLTYAGSGRKLEAEFEYGRVRGSQAPAAIPEQIYRMKGGEMTPGFTMIQPGVTSSVPFDKSYVELTPEQQALVKRQYPGLEEGDEPPYPAKGIGPIYKWITQAQDKVNVALKLRLNVLVGKDGNALSVTTIGASSPEIARFAAMVVAKEKYKPAVCHGAPCEMVYPFIMNFGEQ